MAQQQLFDTSDEEDKDIGIGGGYSIEWRSVKLVAVRRYGVPYRHVEINTGIDKRRLAVELILEGQIDKSKLAMALRVSRQSLNNWENTFFKSGFEGLVNSYKGGTRKGRADKADKLPTGNKARQLEQERRQKRENLQEQQLQISFESSEIAESSYDKATQQEQEAPVEAEPRTIDFKDIEQAPAYQEAQLPELFEQTYDFKENRYAGSFIYWGIFQNAFNVMGLCRRIIGHYSVIIYLFAMMMVNGFGSIEQLKTVYKREFGNLVGIRQLLSKPNIWKLVHNLCRLGKSGELIEKFFHEQAKKSLVALYWLYIDGHFVPYYGKDTVHSGFYTQRGQAMPGQTEMFVHDCQGQIVYFEIQEGKGDLKKMMRQMSEKWQDYIGKTPPLIIVDREAWGVEHFLSLTGYRFVTWEKFSDIKELRAIAEDSFSEEFFVNNKAYRAFEDEKTYWDNQKNHITLRRIVIWNQKTDRRVACVCQDDQESTVSIATAMLGRWGCSENAFKHMAAQLDMHYNPEKDTSSDSAEQSIANPQLKELKDKKKQLKQKLAKTERSLGKLPLTKNKDGSLRKSKKRDALTEKVAQLKLEISETEEKIANSPERIDINEITGKHFKAIETEGKNYWNLAEALFWNSRKKLIEIFRGFLSNERDLQPVLDAITQGRGWIKSTKEVMEIRLEPIETPRFHAAQIQLCRYLNDQEIRLENGKRILYDVGPDPRDSVQ